jgi:hypothetical protein
MFMKIKTHKTDTDLISTRQSVYHDIYQADFGRTFSDSVSLLPRSVLCTLFMTQVPVPRKDQKKNCIFLIATFKFKANIFQLFWVFKNLNKTIV